MPTQFDGLKEVLENMTPEYRQMLIDKYQAFGSLRCLCQAKGYIEVLPNMTGIRVLKNTPEVKELKKVIDILKPGRFKWVEIGEEEKIESGSFKKKKKGIKSA
jgi:hypothetical protein